MSHRNSRRTALALSLAAAVFAVGTASAGDRPVLSKVVADSMKRDLGLNDAQLAQYFAAERTAFLNEARLARQLGDRYAAAGWNAAATATTAMSWPAPAPCAARRSPASTCATPAIRCASSTARSNA